MPRDSFLKRYQNGDRIAVWDELVALGKGVRHQLYVEDAVEVARETMRRARHNVELLIPRLAEMGYRFIPPAEDEEMDLGASLDRIALNVGQSPLAGGVDLRAHLEAAKVAVKERMGPLAAKMAERNAVRSAKVAAALATPPLENRDVFDPPNSQTDKLLQKIEKAAGGPFPISLRAWYEEVGGVSFMGSHDIINPQGEITGDPLVVSPLRELVEMMDAFGAEDRMALWIAPDDYHKANVSGGEPYTIHVPNACADAKFEYEWRRTTFVNYLRKAFEWGGFPGWERSRKPPRQAIATLTEGLLPI